VITKTDLAYAAGIIDGEGCITLWKRGSLFRLSLVVATCDKYICPWLFRTFGGRLYPRKLKDPTRHPQYFWYPKDSDAGKFLRAIFPYLKLKQEQAKVGLKYRFIKEKYCPRGKHNTPALRRLFTRWKLDLEQMKRDNKLPRGERPPRVLA
jgi:hypothetical protein